MLWLKYIKLMKVIKIFFLFIAIAVVIAGITVLLWLDKALPYFSELRAPDPDSLPEINTIPDIPPGTPEINADREYIPPILSALNHTDKNVVRFIKSITVLDDLNQLRIVCENGEAVGCARSYVENNAIVNSSIYIASKNNYDPRCGTFDMILHHEIGHAVYYYQYGLTGYSKQKDEAFARNYARNYAGRLDPRDAYKKVATSFDLNELKCVY